MYFDDPFPCNFFNASFIIARFMFNIMGRMGSTFLIIDNSSGYLASRACFENHSSNSDVGGNEASTGCQTVVYKHSE
jgi:hypothetical protein